MHFASVEQITCEKGFQQTRVGRKSVLRKVFNGPGLCDVWELIAVQVLNFKFLNE